MENQIESLLAQVEATEDDATRASLLKDLSRLYEHALGDPDRAFTALLAADLVHDHAGCREDLDRLAQRTGRWRELADALYAAAERTSDVEQRVFLFVDAATLLRQIDERERARAACRHALDADPSSRPAIAALERLVREGGNLDELLDLFDERLRTAREEERLLIRREAAAHCVLAGRTDDAIRRYEEIRAEIPADLEALRALERLYAASHPREHLDALSALAGVLPAGKERTHLYLRLAAGWETLGERDRATESLEWAIAAGEHDDPTFETLARLYQADARWCAAADAISRHAEHTAEHKKAGLYVQLGMIFEEHVEDAWRAIDYYEKANELMPRAEATLVALARLYEATEAYERAAHRLEEAAQIARTPSARTGRLARAAELLVAHGHAADGDRALWAERLLKEALALSPGYPPAARALSQLHLARGEHQAAADLLAGAVLHAADDDERADLLFAIGQVEESLGNQERALASYRRALEVEPSRRDAEVRASEMLFALGLDHEAMPLLERLCDDEPDADVRADRLVRLARVQETLGDRARALRTVTQAQAAAPGHFEARRVEGELLFADGRWAAARALLEQVVADDAGQLGARDLARLQTRIGAAAMALGDASAALAALEQALRIDPDHLEAWKRALELYVEHGRWLDALAASERIAALEPEAKIRARYLHIVARICDEELHNAEDALAFYRRAVEEDPELDRAAEAIEHLLEVRGDHAELLQHYTSRIQALGPVGGPADAERVRLWTAIAETCEAMGDHDAARIALEVTTKLDGSQLELRERLAAACVTGGDDHLDRAITEHQEIIARAKSRVGSYQALAGLYVRTGRPDRAAACADAAGRLVALGLAERGGDEAVPVVESRGTGVARRPLAAQDWTALRHPEEDGKLAALWARVAPMVAAMEAQAHRAHGLRPRDAVDADDVRPFAIAAREAARLVGITAPELHVRHEQVQPTSFLNLRTESTLSPVLLVGTPLLGDRRRVPELLFPLGLAMSNLRPERLLRLCAADPASIAYLIDAVKAVAAEADGQGKAPSSRTVDALRTRMTPLMFDQVIAVGRKLRARGADSAQMATRWLRATDLTAARAALALTGDLGGAIRCLASDDRNPFVDVRERVLDLVWSSVTDAFAEVRARIADPAPARDRAWAADPLRAASTAAA